MTIATRPATPDDLEPVADLLLADARGRAAADSVLWKLDREPRQKILQSIKAAMEAESPAFRQQWLVAETDAGIVGVTHSILLPVPPIYAGELGPPGLVMEDSFVSPAAPAETRAALLAATQADLTGAGARLLLASSVAGGAWEGEYVRQGFVPVTLYFARTGLRPTREVPQVRPAREADIADIVAASAANRRVLRHLHPIFWKPHPEADARFEGWMRHSLTLGDRDMFVASAEGAFRGYAISQPATWLHFPSAHDISATGTIDDYFHDEIETVDVPSPRTDGAQALLEAAESALGARGKNAALVVCPAAWRTKIALLEAAGYRKAITWFIRIPS